MSGRRTVTEEGLPLNDRVRIDEACDRFESAWRAGEAPDLTTFLAGAEGSVREALFRELLALELEYRRTQGERPRAGDYLGRFPEHREPIEAVFPAAPGAGEETEWAGRGEGPVPDPPAEALLGAGYRIVGELGRGGMGVVYKAYQDSLHRFVAVKLIRSAEFATEAERRRFQNEAETVAQLDHPNIVPIYEVGRRRGVHFFSMKLVAGVSLDRRVGAFGVDARGAARLLAVVAEAIHHAHQRGILHRDLKPSNILLDEGGEPHVTDFGLARRVDSDGDLTHSGAIVGSPAYMSPEQASGATATLTTATDVYGLGSILYALLAGRAPFASGSVVETLDRVRSEAPEPPSKADPRVPRDLEVICLKCLEKDPRRRYASAKALADDLGRWLAGEPIEARPAGAATRARLWCRRNPLPAALAAVLALTFLVGFAAVAALWREAERERVALAALNDFLTRKLLGQAAPENNPRGGAVTVVELLDRASARVGGEFVDRPDVKARILETIGASYLGLGEYAKAEPHLRAGSALLAELWGPEHADALRAANLLTAMLGEAGRLAEAEPLVRANLAAARRALGPGDPVTLEAQGQLGVLLWRLGRPAEAEPLLRRALEGRCRVLGADALETLRTVNALGLVLRELGKLGDSDALASRYEHDVRCTLGPNHPDNVVALTNLGQLRRRQGRPDAAEPFYRRAAEEARRILGPGHPKTLEAEREHARLLQAAGRPGGVGTRAGDSAGPPAPRSAGAAPSGGAP